MIQRTGKRLNNKYSFSGENRLKRWFFLFFALIVLSVLFFAGRKAPMQDPSNGKFSKTFQTSYGPLRKELRKLEESGFFRISPRAALIPAAYAEWYQSPQTAEILSGNASPDWRTDIMIRKSFSSTAKNGIVFLDPLENPVPGDLFRILELRFQNALRRKYREEAETALTDLFHFASDLQNSNAPDLFFLEEAVRCGKQYEASFPAGSLEKWNQTRRELSGRYLYPYDTLCRLDRMRTMREFEKIRLNGLRLYDGRPKSSTQMKEGFGKGSLSMMWKAACSKINDFFYDVDRDQALTLSMYREILEDGKTPETLKHPDRKMAIHAFRRLENLHSRLTDALTYLDPGTQKL